MLPKADKTNDPAKVSFDDFGKNDEGGGGGGFVSFEDFGKAPSAPSEKARAKPSDCQLAGWQSAGTSGCSASFAGLVLGCKLDRARSRLYRSHFL